MMRDMRSWLFTLVASVGVLAAACDDGSGFAGDYEVVSIQDELGSCGGEKMDEPVLADDQFFRLADVDTSNGPLVGYYACVALGNCTDLYDITLSFGPAKDDPAGWAGYISSAIPSTGGCQLGYHVRTLSRGSDDKLHIDERVFRMTDDTLIGSDCNFNAAAERGDSMPCDAESTTIAEDR